MNKRHLTVAVVAVLALSSSTLASAEGGSHKKMGQDDHSYSISPIALGNIVGHLGIDTSTIVPKFEFDTSTVTPHIDFDTSTATTHLDDEPGISDDGEEDVLPADNSLSQFDDSEQANLTIPPAVPGTPPTAPSWITKPHAKSNDSNQDHSEQSSEDSKD